MTFTIITHVLHKRNSDGVIGAYAPYVKEMNVWLKYVDKVVIVAPIEYEPFGSIDIAYQHANIEFIEVPQIEFTSSKTILRSLMKLPEVMCKIAKGMCKADHIHLRCPGNMGLLGCVMQICFPHKPKTAKYAGNWDWESIQPATYRWQQKILQSIFWTKNMTALVYGSWKGMSCNIKPFFTATYSRSEIEPSMPRPLTDGIRLLFVGTLSEGKRPMLSAEVLGILSDRGVKADMVFLGEGAMRKQLEDFIRKNGLENKILLRGNVRADEVKQYMQESHFLVFASRSEGWPKAVAEAMFWGCLPITTSVSCVSEMLGNGDRGSLVSPDKNDIADAIQYYLSHPDVYTQKVHAAMEWSHAYTLEYFESEIKKLL